jgi:ribosomal-protein-alanine N-acetyltransferase
MESAALQIAATSLLTHEQPVRGQWNLLTIRAAGERDYPAIARLQALCPEAAQWPVGDYSNFHTLLALTEAGPAGFCAWRQTASDEAELLNLGVDPAARRRGVAAALLEALRGAARGEIFLEVAEPNHAAIALYRKLGWIVVAIRKGYYARGNLNAVVMKKSSW